MVSPIFAQSAHIALGLKDSPFVKRLQGNPEPRTYLAASLDVSAELVNKIRLAGENALNNLNN